MLAVVALASMCAVAQAQRAAPAWSHYVVRISPDGGLAPWHRDARVFPARGGPATHARTGAVIGGIVMGAVGAILGAGLCHFDDPCPNPAPYVVGGFVLGAAVGAAIGVRIGSGYPRDE